MPNLKPSEDKFYKALREIFIGAKIEGKGGYVNLMNIKSRYFEEVLLKGLWNYIDELFPTDKEELFSKLYTFFSRYFSETGSICFQYTPLKENIYERVYTNKDDVVLFYKTHMLYYVKSEKIWKSLDISIKDDNTLEEILFSFDASEIELAKNNEKKEVIFSFQKVQDSKVYMSVGYSKNATISKYDEIIKEAKKGHKDISLEILDRAISVYKKQTEVDFFINKNANSFLKEQWDLWMYQYVFQWETDWTSGRIGTLQKMKDVAYKLIDYIAQFEDELVKVWNKPKFVRNSHYVMTLDKLSAELVEKVLESPNFTKQFKEWESLGYILDDFEKSKVLQNGTLSDLWQCLTIDTVHFPELESEIVASFENLDETLEGVLIKWDNYQALNNLSNKYREEIGCIYIDPPYNTDSSAIIYANNYKDSSWLTLMENRLSLSRSLLADSAINIMAIDDVELRYLTQLWDAIFQKDNYITLITTECNPQGRVANKVSKTSEHHILHSKNSESLKNIYVNKLWTSTWTPLKRTWTNSRREIRPNRYYPLLVKDNKISLISKDEYSGIYNKSKKEFNDNHVEELRKKYTSLWFDFILPEWSKWEKLVWQRKYDRVEKEKTTYEIRNGNIYTPAFDKEIPRTLWKNPLFSNPEYGSEYLKNVLGHSNFATPKSYHTIVQFLSMFGDDTVILDYFWWSGTTAQWVIESNRIDEGSRKYILAELWEHYFTVIIPRIKKLCFSSKWKDGKAQNKEWYSHFFKYYSLEQYEEALERSVYWENVSLFDDNHTDTYSRYIFLADEKMTRSLERDEKSGKVKVDLSKLYPDIDIPETLSHILGKKIKTIREGIVTFADGQAIDTNDLDYNIIKPLIWWK